MEIGSTRCAVTLRAKLLADFYLGGVLQALLKPPTVLLAKILCRDHNLGRCSSLTFIKMMGGGSLVIAYPSLLATRNSPQVKQLRLITTSAVRPFAEILGVFDEIIVIRDDSAVTLVADSFRALRKVFRCDAIVDLEIHSRLTTVFSVVTCAVNRVGFYTGNSFWRQKLATQLLFCNISNGIYHFYDQIGSLFGGQPLDTGLCVSTFRKHLGLTQRAPHAGALRIGLAPCCSELGRERMLLPSQWVEVLRRRFSREDPGRRIEIQLLGARSDEAALDRLSHVIHVAFPDVVTANNAGKMSLAEAVRELAEVDELICIDSALLHFARLMGIPTISFWGPTDPASRLRASDVNHDEVHYHKLPCSPCVHVAPEPPCRGNNLCIRLAVNPDRPVETNPKWVLSPDPIDRFKRKGSP
jgi:ADP-heptose:LPS heptosyltransferase